MDGFKSRGSWILSYITSLVLIPLPILHIDGIRIYAVVEDILLYFWALQESATVDHYPTYMQCDAILQREYGTCNGVPEFPEIDTKPNSPGYCRFHVLATAYHRFPTLIPWTNKESFCVVNNTFGCKTVSTKSSWQNSRVKNVFWRMALE